MLMNLPRRHAAALALIVALTAVGGVAAATRAADLGLGGGAPEPASAATLTRRGAELTEIERVLDARLAAARALPPAAAAAFSAPAGAAARAGGERWEDEWGERDDERAGARPLGDDDHERGHEREYDDD
jgi:hypothetical protein